MQWKTIKDISLPQNQSIFDYDYNAIMVMHSVKLGIRGKDLTNLESKWAKKLFSEFGKGCTKAKSGFVDYLWPKACSEKPLEEISYVQGLSLGDGFHRFREFT